MAVATLEIKHLHGAGPTEDTVTTPRMSTMDDDDPGTSNPIPIAGSGSNFSFWMSLNLDITAMNDATLLNNHKLYMDGACGWTLGTGGELWVATKTTTDDGCPLGSYDQATGTVGTTGHDMDDVTNGHTYYKTGSANYQAPTALDGWTSGAPGTIDTGDHTIAENFKHCILQCEVDDDATRGAQVAETITFMYDEV